MSEIRLTLAKIEALFGQPGTTDPEALQRAFHHLVLGMTMATGSSFFPTLVEHLAQALRFDYAHVGELVEEGDEPRIRVEAAYDQGRPKAAGFYALAGTPCEQVLATRECCYPDGVQGLFPDDVGLVRMGARAYAGIPLLDAQGRNIGLITIIHREPVADMELVRQVLRVFAIRAASELERQIQERALRFQATHDSLTHLPNRSHFFDRLGAALAADTPPTGSVAVMFLDLDNFQVLNDSLGHTWGDRLLVAVARRLRAAIPADSMVARLGGDEFAVMIQSPREAMIASVEMADTVQRALVEPFDADGRLVHIAVTIGLAANTDRYYTPEALLRNADMALNQAKGMGKGQYALFDARLEEAARQRLQVETELRRALAEGEFRLYYQPIVALDTGSLVGFESLVRWQHPERGLLTPAQFLSVAEETRLIIPLGDWVLREATRQMQEWRSRYRLGDDCYVSVNLSAQQLLHPSLPRTLTRVLEETGLPPRAFQLEVTEGAMLIDERAARRILQAARAVGVRFAVDDFGTGYSALGYLQRFPFDTLKVDRSFVAALTVDRQGQAIVRMIIGLAQNLGLVVTAEGIETAEQRALLLEMGCPHGQGYLFARPLSAEQVEVWLGVQFR